MALNNNFLADHQTRIESKLGELFARITDIESHQLVKAMQYSTLGGGKRIRALLVYASGHSCGLSTEMLDAPAMAVELIHAFSLIHDDLPAMDDDDLRRGKPTCHIAFDEATAILAGDALQTLAFEVLAEPNALYQAQQQLKMLHILARASGAEGMAGGQYLDVSALEQPDFSHQDLKTMHHLKTGKLIEASVTLGASACADTSEETQHHLQTFAYHIGIAFQIQDDILDLTQATETLGKTANRDKDLGKPTYPALLGLAEAQACAKKHYQAAQDALSCLSNTTHLADLANYIVYRDQ